MNCRPMFSAGHAARTDCSAKIQTTEVYGSKRVHPTEPIFSVRITSSYRALGVRTGEEIVWFWIGTHAAYERLLAQRLPKA